MRRLKSVNDNKGNITTVTQKQSGSLVTIIITIQEKSGKAEQNE
jgi:hypothetical protein